MAEEIFGGGKRKRIKVKKGETIDPKKIEGYTLKKEKGGKQIYEKTTTSTTPPMGGQSQYREPTAEEKSRMSAGTFYTNPNPIQYRNEEPGSTSKSTERIILTKKEPKMKKEKGDGFLATIGEKMRAASANREMRRMEKKYATGCKTPRRKSQARY